MHREISQGLTYKLFLLSRNIPIRRLAATVGIAIGDEELISMGAASIEAKPRDLYDLWFLLSNNFTIDADLVNKKMQFDHAIFSIERLKARIEEIRPLWESDLKPLTKMLPSYEEAAKIVLHAFA